MRNLSYAETGISLVLITAASVAAYQSWFAPALAATERDRQAVELILTGLAKQRAARATPSVSATVLPMPQPTPTRSEASTTRSKGRTTRKRGLDRAAIKGLELECPENDPLCGAIEK